MAVFLANQPPKPAPDTGHVLITVEEAKEYARLKAVVAAVETELRQPGAVTKAELRRALATAAS